MTTWQGRLRARPLSLSNLRCERILRRLTRRHLRQPKTLEENLLELVRAGSSLSIALTPTCTNPRHERPSSKRQASQKSSRSFSYLEEIPIWLSWYSTPSGIAWALHLSRRFRIRSVSTPAALQQLSQSNLYRNVCLPSLLPKLGSKRQIIRQKATN